MYNMSDTHFNHLIIATLEDMDSPPSPDNLIKEALYIKTEVPKTLGDTVVYGDTPMIVVVAGDEEKKVVMEINKYIKIQNELLMNELKYKNTTVGKNQLDELMEILNDLDIDLLKE